MIRPLHLLADISGHGYGHLAQTAPVLNALRLRLPAVQFSIRSSLPHALLQQHIVGDFTHIPLASDFGLSMTSAMDVDVPGSIQRYRDFHAHWETQVADYAQQLRQIQPTVVLSNISYLALAAAHTAQIPALAMSSLNWLDVFFAYVGNAPGLATIRGQMCAAYNNANVFLRLAPGIPMPQIQRLIDIAPVARHCTANPTRLRALLNLDATPRLILIAMGGILMPLPTSWPIIPGVYWIAPRASALARADMCILEQIEMSFGEVLASCDAVITKSTYGTFVEATLCATPVLYVARPDWPEQPGLATWISEHNRAHAIRRAQYDQGQFATALEALLKQSPKPPLEITGMQAAAGLIADCLTQPVG